MADPVKPGQLGRVVPDPGGRGFAVYRHGAADPFMTQLATKGEGWKILRALSLGYRYCRVTFATGRRASVPLEGWRWRP